MAEINVAGYVDEILIYDDPDYCTTDLEEIDFKFCKWLQDSDCILFPENCKEYFGDDGSYKLEKCPRCKAAYRKSKIGDIDENEMSDNAGALE